jgi:plastocyanin
VRGLDPGWVEVDHAVAVSVDVALHVREGGDGFDLYRRTGTPLQPMAPLSSKLAVTPDEVLEVKLNKAPKGEYKYYCTPHLAMGMKGKLTVR